MAETVRVLVEEEEVDKSRSVKIMKEKKCISSVY